MAILIFDETNAVQLEMLITSILKGELHQKNSVYLYWLRFVQQTQMVTLNIKNSTMLGLNRELRLQNEDTLCVEQIDKIV